MVYVRTGPTVALTPEAPAFRYADFSFDVARDRLIAVQEYHPNNSPSDVVNTLVAIPLTGTPALGDDGLVTHTTLASGCDFYSNPRVSPDGTRLACVVNVQGCPPAGCATSVDCVLSHTTRYVCWNHPNMPWDKTALAVASCAYAPYRVHTLLCKTRPDCVCCFIGGLLADSQRGWDVRLQAVGVDAS